jgi:hypothetical protein
VRRLLVGFALVFAPVVSWAQLPRDTLNPTGMVGGIFWAPVKLVGPRVDDQLRRNGGGIRIGFRARLPERLAPDAVRLGLDGSVTVTNIRGMRDQDPFAFASVDVGPTLSVRLLRRLRTYAFARAGKQTAELRENGDVWNYAAGWATSMGGGLELPITREGRGVDVAVQWLRGTFGSRERRGVVQPDVSMSYHAWRLAAGWSGPITISLPWR